MNRTARRTRVAVVFAFAAMLAWGVGDFLIQRSTRSIGAVEALGLIGLIGALALTPFAVRDLPLGLLALTLLVLLGVLVFTSGVLNFEALRVGKLGIVDVVLTFELPVTILLALLIFHESLTPLQWAIIGVAFAGIVLIAIEDLSSLRWEHGITLALLTALAYGSVNFFTASAARLSSAVVAIWLPWAVMAALCVLWLARKGTLRELPGRVRSAWKVVVAMALVDTLAWVCYAVALRGGGVAITTAITESYPAVALLLGVLVNKERVVLHQYAGGALALGASVALAFI